MRIDWSEKNIHELELFFSTDIRTGLDRESYKNARKQYGANVIKSKILEKQNFYGLEKKKNNLKLIFSRTISIFGIIYIALLIILKLMGADINIYAIAPFLIFSIISTLALNSSSEKKHAYLYRLCRPRTLVVRGGKRKRVFIESIVPGDVIILSTGDIVPADARLVVSNSLSCIEITSDNKTSHIDKTDRILNIPALSISREDMTIVDSNIVFATDIIMSGSGLAVVIATGKDTRIIRAFGDFEYREVSGIPQNEAGELSILQKEAAGMTQTFSLTSIFFAGVLLLFGVIVQRDLASLLLISFTIVASIFSDKLPTITDFAVMQGMNRLSSRGILIKKSSTVDKLNNVDTLIAKKNETYIRDILKAQKIYYDHWDYDISPKNIMKIGHILSYMALCANVGEARTKKGKIIYTGSAVDVAAANAFQQCDLNFTGLHEVYQRFEKTAYNPQSGSKSILVYSKTQNKFFLICFGEAENILRRCVRREAGEHYFVLDRRTFDMYKRKIEDLYNSYDLVMAVAIKEYAHNNLRNIETDENALDFVGIISFSESDIFGVYENIDYLKKSGVSPVMIVDVNNDAAQRAAKRLGIIEDRKRRRRNQSAEIYQANQSDYSQILDDEKIAHIDDGVFYSNVQKYKLFMPISIQNRVKFLKALKFRKKTSAATVSALTELPVLKEADVSFTPMSVETGVLINKSSVILKNLSISAISNALKGAAVIYKNVHNIISFTASLFTAQYLLAFFALILDGRYLLNEIQILWSGVIIGYMCAAAMCFGEDTSRWYIFRNKIKDYKKYEKEIVKSGIFTGVLIFFTAVLSFGVCLILEEFDSTSGSKITDILLQYIGSDKNGAAEGIILAQTGSFITLLFDCLTIAVFNIKSSHLSDLKILKNTVFIATAVGNIILLIAVMAIPPLRDSLGFALLSAKSIISAILIGIIIPSVYLLIKIKKTKFF